ncbi:molybdate ABC transporter substrate-binding protein [Vibrio mangrovi]|uniref:Molybdate ABC transporter substrate-binding protein n=1 Tax=Vibrio mangrovi TaxID=474394 RepID=A0A1Y6IVE0_9VIBR|nr:molybdate ABC transporter substrate-binding protein [Vibrio mangrovi]MDW6004492.1 molybdate ABC transporter substrate-binding protein [Vibrio mangrovi]SMS00780.1 Molybdate-binding periplasmic protein precursor [Vibrio mangrovi]
MKVRFIVLVSGLLLSLSCWSADALFAVANNFYGPMKALSQDFESQSPHHISISTGATGQLYVQITQGAPFDLFFAADTARPEKLIKDGQASGEFTYARGTLVLWSAQPDIAVKDALLRGEYSHLAVANPKLAPYGLAAQQALEKMGLYTKVQEKIVLGKGLNPTYQFVVTGNAELGFVAKSQVYQDNHYQPGSYWEVPREDYAEIRQDAVILPAGQTNEAAQAFLVYLKTERAQKIIQSYGYM